MISGACVDFFGGGWEGWGERPAYPPPPGPGGSNMNGSGICTVETMISPVNFKNFIFKIGHR